MNNTTHQQSDNSAKIEKAEVFPFESESFTGNNGNEGQKLLSDKKYTDLSEPITHVKNKTFIEKFFMSCFHERNSLTPDEMAHFNLIRDDANTTFDNHDPKFDDKFKEIWNNLSKDKRFAIPEDDWKKFGFQNANPRSDIRGGGLLAVKQLVHFTDTQGDILDDMLTKDPDFLFGVSSINISYYLKNYYHLSNQLVFEKDKKLIGSRIAVKSFCQTLEEDHKLLDKIHTLLLTDLWLIWRELKSKIKNLTILDFGLAQNILKKKFKMVTKERYYYDFGSLKAAYNKHQVTLPSKKPAITAGNLS